VFGRLDAALEASRRLHVFHALARGVVPAQASERRAGERYRANDPVLLLWVLATLYEASAYTFDLVVRPLTPAERARYWAEMRLLGLAIGIPEPSMPVTIADFDAYWDAMLAGDELEAGSAARELAAFLADSTPLRMTRFTAMTPLVRFDDLWLAGIAPAEWSRRLGLDLRAPSRRALATACGSLRTVGRIPALQRTPAHHQALVRVELARGGRPPLSAVAIERINARVRLPLSLAPVSQLTGDQHQVRRDLFGKG
jgi:uncharacterized protein (DUF2236 family)